MEIVRREQWKANPLYTPAGDIPIPTPEVWAHHVGGHEPGAAGMRHLQQMAINGQLSEPYIDIPYSFKIDEDGGVYEARGVAKQSGATKNHNQISHAIVFDGNFMVDEPSSAQLEAAARLLAYGFRLGWWQKPEFTGGHRDANPGATQCPGDHLEAQIANINKRAHALTVAVTPPVKVKPMHDPPVVPVGGIAADVTCPSGGAWGVTPDGHVYTFGGAPYLGAPYGNSYWGKRQAARIQAVNYGNIVKRKYGYRIYATTGETYDFKPK